MKFHSLENYEQGWILSPAYLGEDATLGNDVWHKCFRVRWSKHYGMSLHKRSIVAITPNLFVWGNGHAHTPSFAGSGE